MSEVLFGYTVEESDGGLVITVRGSFAEDSLRQLRERLADGGSLPVLSLLSPLVPIGRLLSARVDIRSERSDVGDASAVDQSALSQEIDQTYAAFQHQMDEFRGAVAALKGSGKPAKAQRQVATEG